MFDEEVALELRISELRCRGGGLEVNGGGENENVGTYQAESQTMEVDYRDRILPVLTTVWCPAFRYSN